MPNDKLTETTPMESIVSAARQHEFATINLKAALDQLRIAEEGVAKKRAIVEDCQRIVNGIEDKIRRSAKVL